MRKLQKFEKNMIYYLSFSQMHNTWHAATKNLGQ